MKNKLVDVVDERCICGDLRSQHADRFAKSHGNCTLCLCPQFTWVAFIFKESK